MSIILNVLGLFVFFWVLASLLFYSYPEEDKLKSHRVRKFMLLPSQILAFLLKKVMGFYRVKLSNDNIKRIFKGVLLLGLIIFISYGIFDWLKTGGIQKITNEISLYNERISSSFGFVGLDELVKNIKPFLALLWNIVIILGLALAIFTFGATLFGKLGEICERKHYGDFYKTYTRGLRTIGYLSLLLLPFTIWIFMWIIGNALDSIFFSYKEWSTYSNQYYTYHHNWIMLILGFGSIPLLIALYFPIVKGIKRHLRENKGKKLLLDEIEDLKKENEELKERIKIYE